MTLNEYIDELIAFRDRNVCGDMVVKTFVVPDELDDCGVLTDPPAPIVSAFYSDDATKRPKGVIV